MVYAANRLATQYFSVSGCFLAISIGLSCLAFGEKAALTALLLRGIAVPLFALPCFLFGTICFILAWLPMSRHHTFYNGLAHFLVLLVMGITGLRYWYLFEKAAKDPRRRQEELLKQLLSDNAETEYGKLRQFASIKDREDYKAKHPLTTYDTYRPYVERIADNGEQNLLTKDLVYRLNVSSGTTGKPKLLPSTFHYFTHAMTNIFIPALYNMSRCKKASFFAPVKSARIFFVPRWRYSKSNLPIGPASGFTSKQSNWVMTLSRVLPVEAEDFMPEPAQCYLHWLFSLYDKELYCIDCVFGGALLAAVETLRKNWQQLVYDIRQGRISRNIPGMPLEVINRVEKAGLIWADPERAAELQMEFSRGFEGIFKRLWPRLNLLMCTTTGAHAIYHDRLMWYCGPGINIYSPFLVASEGVFALNTEPLAKEQLFTLQPHMTFMEFIPEEEVTMQDPSTIFLDQLEAGRRYELVITSMLGFYRYRMGDILEVVRFRHGKTPMVRFCGRIASILDLRGEKTSEDMVFSALKQSTPKWEGFRELVDYTTTEGVSLSNASGDEMSGLHYVLFVEAEGLKRQLTLEEVVVFDESLSEFSYPYKSFRDKQAFGKPTIYVVKEGTFSEMKQKALQWNESSFSAQYKTPRYVTDQARLQFLLKSSY